MSCGVTFTDTWRKGVPLAENDSAIVQEEKEMFERWVQTLREEDVKIDQLIQSIREKSVERTEQLVRQRDKALLLLREEIETLKPQVDRRVDELNHEYKGMANQGE